MTRLRETSREWMDAFALLLPSVLGFVLLGLVITAALGVMAERETFRLLFGAHP